jgi:hypothetical protein
LPEHVILSDQISKARHFPLPLASHHNRYRA